MRKVFWSGADDNAEISLCLFLSRTRSREKTTAYSLTAVCAARHRPRYVVLIDTETGEIFLLLTHEPCQNVM